MKFNKLIVNASSWIKSLDSVHIQSTQLPQLILDWNLGKGETQVLSISYNNNCTIPVAIDDKAARRCAEVFNIQVCGTLSIIIRAKKMGLIPNCKNLLFKLQTNGFRISNSLISTALELTGENK